MGPDARYELVEKIAAGSFATVYRAKDLELGREVAVKQIHQQFLDDPKQLDRYWQEAQLLASLQHPNIVTIYDLVRERGWLIMELMQANLAARQAGRPMDLTSLRTTLAHCLRALKFLHEHGIVHGDIKPSNMMIDRRKRVKLGDFGLARRVSDDQGSLLKGTTKYMAPEVVSDDFGDVGPASDLYSLGFAAYELMCGTNFETLFPGLNAFGRDKQVAWMMWHAAPDRRLPEISRVLEGVPDDLAHVIQKLTMKNQGDRYQSADEALVDLKIDLKVVKVGEEGGANGSPSAPPDAAARKKRLLAIGGFSASLLMCLAVLFFDSSGSSPLPTAVGKSGIVREVRADKHELVLKDEETGDPEVLAMGERPSILLNNTKEKILLEELLPGDRILIDKNPAKGGPSIRYIASRPVTSSGRLKSIDPTKHRLVLNIEEGPYRGDLTVRVPEAARVRLNGQVVTLNQLQPEMSINVLHIPDLKTENQHLAETVDAQQLVTLYGFVQSADLEKGMLTIEERQGRASHTLTLPIASDCRITIGDKLVPLSELKSADLQRGDRVTLRHDMQINELVSARNKRLDGPIEEVQESRRLVFVGTPDGKKHRLEIDDRSEIEIGGELARFAELRKYDEAHVTYAEQADGKLQALTIDATRPVKHDRWAIVIGVQNYQDKTISAAPYVLDDARLLADALRKRYQLAEERLLLVLDPTKEILEQRLKAVLEQAQPQTQVVVYFAGQGYVGADDEVYLATQDCELNRIAETGLPLKTLVQYVEACAAKDKILLLDASHEGEGSDLEQQLSSAAMLAALRGDSGGSPIETSVAIASCQNQERGLATPDHKHGQFAQAVADGFKGAADPDRNLQITADELDTFLEKRMKGLELEPGQSQTPARFPPAKAAP